MYKSPKSHEQNKSHKYTQYSTSNRKRLLQATHTPKPCPLCSSSEHAIRSGTRKAKYGTTQIYYCKSCHKYFTTRKIPHTHYKPKIILQATTYYNLGYTIDSTVAILQKRYKTKVPRSTIHSWLKEYSDIFTFSSLRHKYTIDPSKIIQNKKFYHQQIYEFQYHQLKLNITAKKYPGIKSYINKILTSLDNSLFETGPRCSAPTNDIKQALSTNTLPKTKVKKIKTNNAVKMAYMAVELARTKRERHTKIENIFLINDSATIAIEIPVYLLPMEAKNFNIPLNEPLTGHIDILQLRQNKIHILDYKPDIAFDKTSQIYSRIQLLLYAYSLSKRMNIPLANINCAYFDDKNYFQFSPISH